VCQGGISLVKQDDLRTRQVGEKFYNKALEGAQVFNRVSGLLKQEKELLLQQGKLPKRVFEQLQSTINKGFEECAGVIRGAKLVENAQTKTMFSRLPKLVCLLFQLTTIAHGLSLPVQGLVSIKPGTIPSIGDIRKLGQAIEQRLQGLKQGKVSFSNLVDEGNKKISELVGIRINQDMLGKATFLTANPQFVGQEMNLQQLQAILSQPDLLKKVAVTSQSRSILELGQSLVDECIKLVQLAKKLEESRINSMAEQMFINRFNQFTEAESDDDK